MIVIIDYGMGNLRSILHKLHKLKMEAMISAEAADLDRATHLILPGVGHFATGMKNLHESGLVEILNRRVMEERIPILGICLGLQLFTQHSEEGDVAGLGWLQGRTRRFTFEHAAERLRVPHVGWNLIRKTGSTEFLSDVADEQRFYFVHSYYVECDDRKDVAADTHYGRDFVSAIHRGNIYGTQFHPEKSHRRGIEVIRQFVEGSALCSSPA